MAQETTRVYHPDLNTWYDVTNPDEWVEAGWKTSKPKHVDDSEDPKPAEVARAEAKAARQQRSGRRARSLQQEAASVTPRDSDGTHE